MNKKTLIICYSFPPFPGVGGRRWAKFAKYLNANGHDVHIIACQNPFEEKSQWTKDIAHLHITYLPVHYPKSLMQAQPRHLWDKILYQLSLIFVKLADKGNYYDRSIFWDQQIHASASSLIKKNNIKNVIVSGAPFRLTYYGTKLKSLFPHINLIADFRDLWTTDTSISAISNLSNKRVLHEKMMEEITVKNSDVVLTVADNMQGYFNALSKKNNCHVLINGFDEDDFLNLEPQNEFPQDKINVVFTGTLYFSIDTIFIAFLDALQKIKNESEQNMDFFLFHFYGTMPKSIKQLIHRYQLPNVRFYPAVSLNKIHAIIQSATICSLFLTDAYDFSLSTKFYEYVSQRKKIVVFSRKGKTADFIVDNHLGYWVDPNNAYQGLLHLVEEFKKGNLTNWESSINIGNYSIKNLTLQLEKFLI